MLYTSGSTGLPKGVMLSHANLWLGAISVAHFLKLSPSDRTLALLPLAFDYGQNQLLSTWAAGGSVIAFDYLMPRDVVRAVGRHDVTVLAGVPPLWLQLAEADWSGGEGGSLRTLTNSGGHLPEPLVRRLRTLFPEARLHLMYGLTEAFRSTSLDPDAGRPHPDSVGRAIPFAEVMVVRARWQRSGGGRGGRAGPRRPARRPRLLARSGSHRRAVPAGASLVRKLGGTAVWSGDRVVRGADGLLRFRGRDDAMIKVSGNRISPTEIEEAALASGAVRDAAALGVPDERLGQAIILFAVAKGDEAERRLTRLSHPRASAPYAAAAHHLARCATDRPERQARSDSFAGDAGMKENGPIPPGFVAGAEGQLLIGELDVEALVAEAGGTPLFVYDAARIGQRIAEFRYAMPDRVALHYAVKANPYGPLLTFMARHVDGFDIASIGEFERLHALDFEDLPMTFAGPGKRDSELEQAISPEVTINLESEAEAARALTIAGALGIRPKAGGAGQSALRAQGRGDENGRCRRAIRNRP